MFNLFALLRDDPVKPATPMTNGAIDETLQQFAQQVVTIACIQVRAVWGPHVRFDERDVLTPQVRRCVPGSV